MQSHLKRAQRGIRASDRLRSWRRIFHGRIPCLPESIHVGVFLLRVLVMKCRWGFVSAKLVAKS